eukprot:TRINITY_DN44350_c0_g1_i1.p1 TRINITY_DN44350_c0_g1~~TRINITY_DN44350_c0_g1_i1.p1  ORF type:complete len:276 (+),score=29.60 TRINITY_DN44350_c0_g1_i1:108-830(+)
MCIRDRYQRRVHGAFCQSCLESFMKDCVGNKLGLYSFICKGKNCKKLIHPSIIKLVFGEETFEELESQTEELSKADLLCKNCHTQFTYRRTKERKVKCPKCEFAMCSICEIPYHKGRCNRKELIFEICGGVKGSVSPCPYCLKLSSKDEKCNHVTCDNCHNDFCFVCSAKRSPILAHGNHYHREDCKDYDDPPLKDKLEPECSECAKLGKCCKPPLPLENLDIPEEEWPYEQSTILFEVE